LDKLGVAVPEIDVGRPTWPEYQEFLELVGAPAGLLPHIDATALEVAMARLRGRNVATALSFDNDGDCGIFNVSTVPWARRRGLGTALTALALDAAKRRGCTTATLQSTAMAEGVYAALGFEDLGTIREYVRSRGIERRPHVRSRVTHELEPTCVAPRCARAAPKRNPANDSGIGSGNSPRRSP